MWKDKVVLITGSSIGIGYALALEAGKRGSHVILNARHPERLEQSCRELQEKGISVTGVSGDISNYKDCEAIVEHSIRTYGKLDVLVNNAGITAKATVEDMQPEMFRKIMDINFLGQVYMTKIALPHIRKTRGGILFIGSLAGIHGVGNYSAYSSSKMALTAIANTLRIELHGSGVYVGLAYVSTTENHPEKVFLDKEGKPAPRPNRKVKLQPADEVARHLLSMIEKKKFRSYFSAKGKIKALLYRIYPDLVFRIMVQVFKRKLD